MWGQFVQLYELCHEKTGFLHMRKQRRRSAVQYRAADQRLCFHYIDSTIPLPPKSEMLFVSGNLKTGFLNTAHMVITVSFSCTNIEGINSSNNDFSNSPINSIQYQRTNGPVNAHLISWPSKAQNIQNLEKYMVKK